MCCFVKQKAAYELRISDWSSDVCSSDLFDIGERVRRLLGTHHADLRLRPREQEARVERTAAHAVIAGTVRAVTHDRELRHFAIADRKSVEEGKSVSVRVDVGGCRMLKHNTMYNT